jgi:hypothetical protein
VDGTIRQEIADDFGEDTMITDYEKNNRVNAAWDKTRSVLWIALLAVISYHMGLGRGRAEKNVGVYSGLKSQYDRTEAQYSALKAQYDRIEAQRTGATIQQPTQ